MIFPATADAMQTQWRRKLKSKKEMEEYLNDFGKNGWSEEREGKFLVFLYKDEPVLMIEDEVLKCSVYALGESKRKKGAACQHSK